MSRFSSGQNGPRRAMSGTPKDVPVDRMRLYGKYPDKAKVEKSAHRSRVPMAGLYHCHIKRTGQSGWPYLLRAMCAVDRNGEIVAVWVTYGDNGCRRTRYFEDVTYTVDRIHFPALTHATLKDFAEAHPAMSAAWKNRYRILLEAARLAAVRSVGITTFEDNWGNVCYDLVTWP